MYIAPDSDVYLLEGVPLDPTYEHTVMWTDASAQENWFVTHSAHTLTGVSYQRHSKGTIKLQKPIEEVINCNYMAFRNTAFENKMFYAFITNVEYVSNDTCEIFFELDVMQTYLFDAVLEECWVEREHAETDKVGDNVMAEPVDVGNIVCFGTYGDELFQQYDILLSYASRSS